MAVMNPCCCSLRTGTMVVAIFNICESFIFLMYHIIHALFGVGLGFAVSVSKSSKSNTDFSNNRNSDDEDKNDEVAVASLVSLILTIILITFFVVNIILSILLLVGAKQRNISKCWTWFVVTTVFLVFYILYKVALAIMMIIAAGLVVGLVVIVLDLFFFLLLVLGTCYQLWVVYAYVDELKNGGRSGGGTEYPGVVYSVTPKTDDQPASAPQFPPMDYGSPPPPYQPTTYAPAGPEVRPRGPYNPASVGYPVLPVMKH